MASHSPNQSCLQRVTMLPKFLVRHLLRLNQFSTTEVPNTYNQSQLIETAEGEPQELLMIPTTICSQDIPPTAGLSSVDSAVSMTEDINKRLVIHQENRYFAYSLTSENILVSSHSS